MRNLLTRAVFDKTFEAGDKFGGPDLEWLPRRFYSDGDGYHFMDQGSFDTSRSGRTSSETMRSCWWITCWCRSQYNGNPIGVVFPPHVELTVASTELGVRGDTASGGVTKAATLETGLEIRVSLFIKEGEKVKVHTETREFAGRAEETMNDER